MFSAIRLINRLIKTCQAPAQDKSEQIQGDTTAAKSTDPDQPTSGPPET
jgi:hypothetical protein